MESCNIVYIFISFHANVPQDHCSQPACCGSKAAAEVLWRLKSRAGASSILACSFPILTLIDGLFAEITRKMLDNSQYEEGHPPKVLRGSKGDESSSAFLVLPSDWDDLTGALWERKALSNRVWLNH